MLLIYILECLEKLAISKKYFAPLTTYTIVRNKTHHGKMVII